MNNKYRYAVLEHGVRLEDDCSINSYAEGDSRKYLVLLAAADHYYRLKNWKEECPLSIELFTEIGNSLGVFGVEYTWRPNFRLVSEKQPNSSCES